MDHFSKIHRLGRKMNRSVRLLSILCVCLIWSVHGQLQAQNIGCLSGDYPNPTSDSCSSFFRCLGGQVIPFRCPDAQLFDFRNRQCLPSEQVRCAEQLRLFIAPPLQPASAQDAALGGRGAFQPDPVFATSGGGPVDPQTRLVLLPNGIVQRQYPQGQQLPVYPHFQGQPQFPGNTGFNVQSGNPQFPGQSPIPGNPQFQGQFPGNPQFQGQYPGNPQFQGQPQYPGNTQFQTNPQMPGTEPLNRNSYQTGSQPLAGPPSFFGTADQPGTSGTSQFQSGKSTLNQGPLVSKTAPVVEKSPQGK